VVVCGIGKSGLIGRKLVATLVSTGTPSTFLHPAEALHGDLGMVGDDDVVMFLSYSGETPEVTRLIPYFSSRGVPLLAIVGDPRSTLAKQVRVALDVAVQREVCPHDVVPTCSAVATLAMGDALAMALMRARGFSAEDFAQLHPGGRLGSRLRLVSEAMQRHDLPLVPPSMTVGESLLAISRGRCGLAIVVDPAENLLGLVTDGDLRRALALESNLLEKPISEIMTPKPVTIRGDATVTEAETRMQRLRLKALIVLNSEERVSGVIEVFK
jgi:arabinose-5-phosphate isomerase